jgi:hypothetical protein
MLVKEIERERAVVLRVFQKFSGKRASFFFVPMCQHARVLMSNMDVRVGHNDDDDEVAEHADFERLTTRE